MATNRDTKRSTASRSTSTPRAKGGSRGASKRASAGQRGDVSRFKSQDLNGRAKGRTDSPAKGSGSRLAGRPTGLNESPSDYDREGRGPAPKPRRGGSA
jgi:hypothetical protein